MMQQMMSNPMMQMMMQQVMSNLAMLEQMLASNPVAQQMMAAKSAGWGDVAKLAADAANDESS